MLPRERISMQFQALVQRRTRWPGGSAKTVFSMAMTLWISAVLGCGCNDSNDKNASNEPSDGGQFQDSGVDSGPVNDGGPSSDGGIDSGPVSDGGSSDGGVDEDAGQGYIKIETQLGTVKGLIDLGARIYKGIPYAKPPTGENRFKQPIAAGGWDTLDATEFGNICPQRILMTEEVDGDEDCLNLNIWSPAELPTEPMPVMVWLHGGAFKYGAGSESMYDGDVLASKNGVLVVTINYRIGILGFLAHEALSAEDSGRPISGNYGLTDQQLALEWVLDNIADYGGDPENVTLFGESAGAISIGMHLVSPQSAGLFQRAVIQSGPVNLLGEMSLADAEKRGDLIASDLGCDDTSNTLTCLRSIPADELVRYVEDVEETPGGLFFQKDDSAAVWAPVVDGVIIPQKPMEMLESQSVQPVPIIIGTNKDEGTIFLSFIMEPVDVTNEAEYLAALDQKFGPNAAKVAQKYPLENFETPNDAVSEITDDAFFVSQTRRMIRALTQSGFETYVYNFQRAPEGFFTDSLGVMHSAEIMFVFGKDNEIGSIGEEGQELSLSMMSYWTDFASSDDPNSSAKMSWPLWTNTTEDFLILDVPMQTATGYASEHSDFWDEVLAFQPTSENK